MAEEKVLTPLKAGLRFAMPSKCRQCQMGLLRLRVNRIVRPVEVKWKALNHDVLSLD